MDEDDRETAPVEVRLLHYEPMRGGGDLCALLQAEVTIHDVSIVISGIQVLRDKSGGFYLRAPRYRSSTGEWKCAVEMETAVWNSLMELLSEALIAQTAGRA